MRREFELPPTRMTVEDVKPPLDLFACPRCDAAPLAARGADLHCKGCRTTYPDLDGIPWLFSDPGAALGEWQNRLQFALKSLAHESQRIARELEQTGLLDATRSRLEKHRSANDEQRTLLRALLAPLDLHTLEANYETHLALRTRLPSDQGLATYYPNIHRDWVWGDEENAASLAEVIAAADATGGRTTGDTIVLGAGAGRLAYDLHQTGDSDRTVAVDFNPLLALIAARAAGGETVELYEFPIAPATVDDVARKQKIVAPAAARPGLSFVLADALRAPFAEACADTVVTPWLIDIISEDTAVFAARINRLLKPGGRWINFGSLTYSHPDRARRYGPEEIHEIVVGAGFDAPETRDATMPYMASPHSRHARRETVFTFAARKARDTDAVPRHKALPDWIVTGKEPIPLSQSFAAQAMSTRIYAFVMSLIDGKRSIEDMATIFEQQKLMTADEAVPAIRNFLIRMHEDSERNASF